MKIYKKFLQKMSDNLTKNNNKNKKFFLKKKSDKQTEQNHHCKNLYSINGFSILLFSLCENVPQGQ